MLVNMGNLHVHIHKIHKSPSCQKLKDNRRFSVASGLIQHVVDLPAPAHVVISPAKSTFSRGGNGKYPARPALPAIATMKFWDKIFAPAMRVLARKPRPGPVLPGYDIRSKSNWAEVEQCLENARRRYDGDLRRRRGRFKERCRRIAEHGVVGVQAMRFIKEVEYVSVVMGVVEVLVDAATRAASVRERARLTLNPRELEHEFAQIEILLSVHPNDRNIQQVAIDLVVAIFEAIEEGINFYMKHRHRRAFEALALGDRYQQRLLDKLASIKKACDQLKETGQLSHVFVAIHSLRRLLDERESREMQQQHHVQRMQDQEARLCRLEGYAQRVEVGVESLGHKLESGVMRAIYNISSNISHMHGIEGQRQLSLEQEVKGQDYLIRVLSKMEMLEDESDNDSEEVFSD
ncbi:hypothetical protein NCU06129 [Neurospora crassa OR74A]|uniref:DUF7708 domain-containing protein n=1 Tax=Neurospora crassa (strain ATCC 24698 / 74-OR23-1A / CBS 708.71 / DSM 1257 / FGSC 987) TaxID=367110 RepID=Q7S5F9_NEUCR|nr:hypothetical protein NCU06129 [Neurospora crassa OR74A]EAA30755.1 hypothetical protein NCU06129 [Neurospora crassa OR74A]|eukprot:XP_959991.1 hypothetical protein NCU06129 [Neurospora crassa OR74A]